MISLDYDYLRKVRLEVYTEEKREDIYNVVGTIPGDLEPGKSTDCMLGWELLGFVKSVSKNLSNSYLKYTPICISNANFWLAQCISNFLDRRVIIGNHRDAWVYGGVDPSGGTACLMEISRALGLAMKKGNESLNDTWRKSASSFSQSDFAMEPKSSPRLV